MTRVAITREQIDEYEKHGLLTDYRTGDPMPGLAELCRLALIGLAVRESGIDADAMETYVALMRSRGCGGGILSMLDALAKALGEAK